MAASMAALAEENDIDDDTNPWPPRNHKVFSLLLKKMKPFLFLDKLFDERAISKDEWITLQQISETKAENVVKELMGVILPRKSPAGYVFDKFCTILKGTVGQEEVADILLKYANRSCSSPQAITKTVRVYIPSEDESLVKDIKPYLASVFNRRLWILDVFIYPVSAPRDCRPDSKCDTATPLVLSDSVLMIVVLKGVMVAQFAESR